MRVLTPCSTLITTCVALAGPAAGQESYAIFDTPVVRVAEDEAPFRRMLDFNGDGVLDAVGMLTHQDGDRFRVASYRNIGGRFLETWSRGYTLTEDASSFLIETGHLNDDDKEDFCVMAGRDHYDFLSSGPSWSVTPALLESKAQALALHDITGNGIADHVWVDEDRVRVRVGPFDYELDSHGGDYHTARVFDANGAGLPDIVFGAGSELRIYYATAGGLQYGPWYTHWLADAMLDVGDIDGDGDEDIVIFEPPADPDEPARYRVCRRVGPAEWDLEPIQIGGPAEFLLDVDGDGDLDGVCCGGGGGGGGGPPPYDDNDVPTAFQISLNDGQGNFDLSFQLPGLGSPQLAGVTDVDGDGDLDLVAGRCIYYAKGPITRSMQDDPEFALPVAPSMRSAADYDGDGDPDFGLCLSDVWANDGNGFFRREAPDVAAAPAGTEYRGSGFSGDFDGDGMADLLVEHWTLPQGATPGGKRRGAATGAGIFRGTRFLRNDGHGRLTDGGPASLPRVSLALGSFASDASILGDLDADGDLDLVALAPRTTRASQLWLNDGAGFFLPLAPLPDVRVEHVRDLDLDGLPELVGTAVHPLYDYDVRIHKGSLAQSGLPQFLDVSELLFENASPVADTGLALGDYTRDGFLDLGVVEWPSTYPKARIYYDQQSQGGVGFASGLYVSFDATADSRVAMADLNGDGTLDGMATGVEGGPELAEYWLSHPTSPSSGIGSDLQILPAGILLDVDSDGDPDLVAGDRIVFNNATTP